MSGREWAVGEKLAVVAVDADRARIAAYAAASGDQNPIHVDDAAARAIGLTGAIAHGMWTFGVALRVLAANGFDPAGISAATCRFGRPVVLPAQGPARLHVGGQISGADERSRTLAIEVHHVTPDGPWRVAKLEVTVAV